METRTQTHVFLLTFSKSNGEFHKMSPVPLNLFRPFGGSMTIKENNLLLPQLPTRNSKLTRQSDLYLSLKGKTAECGLLWTEFMF